VVVPPPVPAVRAEAVTVVEPTIITDANDHATHYAYALLNRLTSADYSTAEAFEYEYDAVGNRSALTATTQRTVSLIAR